MKWFFAFVVIVVFVVSVPTQGKGTRAEQFAADAYAHAGTRSQGICAQAIRQALERSTGIRLQRTQHARDYGSSLQKAGFYVISNYESLRPGDVRIIQPTHGHPSGHMQVYTKKGWVSDFRQRDQWPGSAYRKNQPAYTTYRLPN